MTQSLEPVVITPFPDHTQLPESDGTFVKNFQEHPQSLLLTDSLGPVLERLHPNGDYVIGQDCGIYWRETDPPEKGAEAPDWFYVADVPATIDGQFRRSYVLWREFIAPLVALEFASGNGSEERDRTPLRIDQPSRKPGKFWVYERIIRIPFYGIFEVNTGNLEVYHLVDGAYQPMVATAQGRYPITPLGVELGVWYGSYQNQTRLWLRWWDTAGNLLLIGSERAAQAEAKLAQMQHEVEQIRQEAEQTQRNAISRLLAMGLSAEQVAEALGVPIEEIEPS
ncbi:Uma2 family endonuclease [Leptolyngbya sp. NK1-12]|uniref:Uma2 family endonuclease n=1 Tax=Leptolyngbya sp. NK1-12 TaxID=2547451 RepID=A0AA96WS92_9CYAN|nr:Uma2 family endonuclease [Leptolyngbya sp. NK1-12]